MMQRTSPGLGALARAALALDVPWPVQQTGQARSSKDKTEGCVCIIWLHFNTQNLRRAWNAHVRMCSMMKHAASPMPICMKYWAHKGDHTSLLTQRIAYNRSQQGRCGIRPRAICSKS
eukprot:scaffold167027_cov18-Tisochrysis_lutea.AAC.1